MYTVPSIGGHLYLTLAKDQLLCLGEVGGFLQFHVRAGSTW